MNQSTTESSKETNQPPKQSTQPFNSYSMTHPTKKIPNQLSSKLRNQPKKNQRKKEKEN